jgi:rubrerythrin
MYYKSFKKNPAAFITVGKQRLKQNGSVVYLKDGDEFEVEIFNPQQNSVLAKLKINGNYIGGGGVVLRPGQRVFLERYLDEARKFKFETYEVNAKSKEVQEAIKNNGVVEVEFYEENPYGGSITFTNEHGDYGYYGIRNFGNSRDITADFKLYNYNTTTSSSGTDYFTNASYNLNNNVDYNTSQNLKKSLSTDRFKETGRVEKGGSSNQEFTSVNMDFNSYPSSYSTWRLMPTSEKPVEASEVNVLYCTNCGSKRKKDNHKFCPHCGTKF